jgi:hypothetical protein
MSAVMLVTGLLLAVRGRILVAFVAVKQWNTMWSRGLHTSTALTVHRARPTGHPMALSHALVLAALALGGCHGSDGSDGSSSSTGGTTSATTTEGSTVSGTTTNTPTTGTGTMTEATATTEATAATATTTTTATTGATEATATTEAPVCVEPPFDPDPPGPPAAMCGTDPECSPEQVCVFVVPLLTGLCGECETDADCPGGGCTMADPIHMRGSFCNTGKPGAGCDTNAACNNECNNLCSSVIDLPQFNYTIKTCGVCQSSADCAAGELCRTEFDLSIFSGINVCTPAGSLQNGEFCDIFLDGAAACESGICSPAAKGIFTFGVCSECRLAQDCMMGQDCSPAVYDEVGGTVSPAKCI